MKRVKLEVVEPSVEFTTERRWPGILDAAAEHLEECGRVSHKSEGRQRPGSALPFLDRVAIRQGHETLLEHVVYTVCMVMSRAASHQITRHRLSSFCVTGDTVLVAHGCKRRTKKRWTIRQLYDWQDDPKRKGRLKLIRLRSVDGSGCIVPNKIRKVVDTGIQYVFEVKTKCNRVIRCTDNEWFLTRGGWRRLHELSIGDRVLVNGQAVFTVHESEITSILASGIERTFDLEMVGEPRNYVANGFVVHNTQESQRYCDYSGDDEQRLKIVVPPNHDQRKTLMSGDVVTWCPGYDGTVRLDREARSETLSAATNPGRFLEQQARAYHAYLRDRQDGVPAEDARYSLPNATKTELYMTCNLRQWRTVLELRTDRHAQWEVRGLMRRVLDHFLDSPVGPLFRDVGRSVTFRGDELDVLRDIMASDRPKVIDRRLEGKTARRVFVEKLERVM